MSRTFGKNTKYMPMTVESEALDQMAWRGNVTPAEWFLWLKFPNGKADCIGCLILSEIVYWYRGGDVLRDGVVVPGLRTSKFHGDILQKSYTELVEKFGITKRQAQDAMARLENAGVIERVLRHLKVRGRPINNVLFVKIIPERIREITFTVPEFHREAPHVLTGGASYVPPRDAHLTFHRGSIARSTGTPSPLDRETNTKTSSENIQRGRTPVVPQGGQASAIPGSAPEDQPAYAVIPESSTFPKIGSRPDYVAALQLHDPRAAARILTCFPGTVWNPKTARQWLRCRRDHGLSNQDVVVLGRYFREAEDISEQYPKWRPRNLSALIYDSQNVIATVRNFAQFMNPAYIYDLPQL